MLSFSILLNLMTKILKLVHISGTLDPLGNLDILVGRVLESVEEWKCLDSLKDPECQKCEQVSEF